MICTKCAVDQPANSFYRKKSSSTGYSKICKSCELAGKREYYKANKIDILEKQKKDNNRKEYMRNYMREKHPRKTERRVRFRFEYDGAPNSSKYISARRKVDPLFRFKLNIKDSVRKALKKNGYKKNSKTFDIIGCTFEEFKTHIESLWESWMTWENYGLYKKGEYNVGWDIDHIEPLSSAINEEGVIALNHYTNLQPLCSKVNRDEKKAY